MWVFLSGIRFDLISVSTTNALFILLSLIPFHFREFTIYQKTLKIIFLFVNSIALLVNCMDIIYFRFTLKRTTTDILNVPGLKEDIKNLLPQFISDYWYILAIWIFLIAIMEYLYRKTEKPIKSEEKINFRYYLFHSILLIAGLIISVITIRGGTQGKPAGIITAGRHVGGTFVPLALNTPFTLIKTFESDYLEPKKFYTNKEALEIYNPIRQHQGGEFIKLNVVFVIMESFSSEYTGLNGSSESFTPFLDSLAHEGLFFTNAYANGKRSIEGIPAIVASLPGLMNNPFISSSYSANKITSIASLLKEKGYYTTFFHGGNNGTMGFDDFVGLAGFDKYFGRSEYEAEIKNNGADYDGIWGIYDEPFFEYFSTNLNSMTEPFFSTFFSLSSHHPYIIPEKYKNAFKKGNIEIHHSIGYSDMALKKFFQRASENSWYKNTLFVITADHTGIPASDYGGSSVGRYHVPIIFFKPDSDLKGNKDKIMQHVDIMPSVLHLLNYEKPYFSFGQSVFDTTTNGFAVSFIGDTYQLMNKRHVLLHNGTESTAFYDFPKDSLLVTNILPVPSQEKDAMEEKIKAIIQIYNSALIENKQFIR
ncbi:MAG: sulfatase-like hydrolase/transferase [Bacteroidetes bacterium]|nr:sulfatase-like hydrolase/transferase [Bacteroidota bacterium]HET6243322.1 sulfatase-like hydrolase/transferase [Bacteroidia bacterium]